MRTILCLALISSLGCAHAASPRREGLAALLETGGKAKSCAEWRAMIERLGTGQRAEWLKGPQATLADVPYGEAAGQTLDVFLPRGQAPKTPAPILVLVHGGGWCVGDKGLAGVTRNKVDHWGAKGVVVVSVNYPMVSDGADAAAQARHVAAATAYVQRHAAAWGGDGRKVVLMGHSAGAHLVTLVAADQAVRGEAKLAPLLAVVSLDAGAIDVPVQMGRVYPFLKERYLEAFGRDEAHWVLASPAQRITVGIEPWLGVCSTRRADDPCGQAKAFAKTLVELGGQARVLPEDLSHGQLNATLGSSGDAYTAQVDAFLGGLDPALAP